MRGRDKAAAKKLDAELSAFHTGTRALPGIEKPTHREALIEQLLESIRRVKFVSVIASRDVSPLRADPSSSLFDPIRAAVLRKREGDTDEACWLVFLSVHFGRNRRSRWRLVQEVYGQMRGRSRWTWKKVSDDPTAFRGWLADNQESFTGKFGNHRKYQSIDAAKPAGTGAAIESYVNWVRKQGSHQKLIQNAQRSASETPRATFDYLYRSMGAVVSFGRTARFDYLTMLGKLGLAKIEPGSTYMQGATGPYDGGNLLFGGRVDAGISRDVLDGLLVQLGDHLEVGMQVMEDALCNWQKSPAKFVGFRG